MKKENKENIIFTAKLIASLYVIWSILLWIAMCLNADINGEPFPTFLEVTINFAREVLSLRIW